MISKKRFEVPKTIVEAADQARANAMLRFSAAILLINSVVFSLAIVFFYSRRLEDAAQSVQSYLLQLLKIGDIFEATRQLSSMVSSGLFSGFQLVDERTKSILSGNNLSGFDLKDLAAENAWSMGFDLNGIFLISRTFFGGQESHPYSLVLSTQVSLIPFCFVLAFTILLTLLFFYTSAFENRKLAAKVAPEIANFANALSRIELDSDPEDLPLVESSFEELAALKKQFFILHKRLSTTGIALTQAERQSAIARTTQALAHDVRKPFTMFKMIIDAVDGEDDPEEAKQILRESLPEVQQAMASVNGMIADVLEIGSESTPIAEATNPETLIESTITEIFRVYPESQVTIAYSLNHAHKVSVDTLKIGRVFSNIVGNAVQAMGRKGSLWFKTDEIHVEGSSFVRFCLGNGGSFIPAEHLSKLFDAFFTSGKKGGTGLGLAIAQKIVNAHGGRIWCESDEKRGVEFYFTLPASLEKSDARPHPLPTTSSEIVSAIERLRKTAATGGRREADPLEVTLEKEIIKHSQRLKNPLSILVVDDEGVYRNSIAALVNRSEDLKKHINLSFAINSAQALEAAQVAWALVIQDVDLGKDSINGYEVLRALRAQGFQGVVCIHSNRSLLWGLSRN